MRKLLLTVITILALAGCDKKETITHSVKPEENKKVIGIAKIISHPALDATEKGIIDELKNQGYTKLIFDLQSANGEIATAASIAVKYKNNKSDIVVGIATPMAQTLANAMKNTPVVFAAVTDPLDAGLRKNLDKENTNVTGVSDLTPVKEQLVLATKLKPIKKLGFIYNAGEANSIVLLKLTEKASKELGLELITTTVNNTSEIKQAVEIVAPQVDLIYASTDNVVYAALTSLIQSAAKYNVPVVAAVPDDDPSTGSLASYGIDYYNSGREVAKQIISILNGEKTGNIPVKYHTGDELALYINKEVAAKMGIIVPEELMKQSKPMKQKK